MRISPEKFRSNSYHLSGIAFFVLTTTVALGGEILQNGWLACAAFVLATIATLLPSLFVLLSRRIKSRIGDFPTQPRSRFYFGALLDTMQWVVALGGLAAIGIHWLLPLDTFWASILGCGISMFAFAFATYRRWANLLLVDGPPIFGGPLDHPSTTLESGVQLAINLLLFAFAAGNVPDAFLTVGGLLISSLSGVLIGALVFGALVCSFDEHEVPGMGAVTNAS